MSHKIVITGAPASGKTEYIKRLKEHPAFSSFMFFNELARQLLEENPEFRNNRTLFHREIYYRQIKREQEVGDWSFITDRGTVDAFAFHPETLSDVNTNIDKEYARYDTVVQMGSSAILGDKYYFKDNIRLESASDALIIEMAIAQVWKNHPGYYFIKANIDFENKYIELLDTLLSIISK